MDKHILVISYFFPPYPDVGSRRWAKFAKYLAKDGFNVHVICAQNPFKEKSPWTDDINHKNIRPHYLPCRYPKILMTQRKYLWQKIIARLLRCIMKLFLKGIINDFSVFWKGQLEKKASRLIKEYRIPNIIATGPPFRVLYYAALLKIKFPGINIISDLRDTWLDAKIYCYDKLTCKTLEYERIMENYVVQNSGYLTFPDENITAGFQQRYSQTAGAKKFITIAHAYDADNYKFDMSQGTQKADKKIEFVFGGSVPMQGIMPVLAPLFDALESLKQNMPHLYNRLLFNFYVRQYWLFDVAGKYGLEAVSFHQPLPEKEYFRAISQADFLMIFLPDHLKDYRTTKFSEYLPLRKPIIVFSNPGKTGQYVIENKIGYSFTPGDYFANIVQLIKEYDEGKAVFNPDFDYAEFSFENITKKLEALFK